MLINVFLFVEEIISKGPKKALFNDDTSFIMRRTLKPLHEVRTKYIQILWILIIIVFIFLDEQFRIFLIQIKKSRKTL